MSDRRRARRGTLPRRVRPWELLLGAALAGVVAVWLLGAWLLGPVSASRQGRVVNVARGDTPARVGGRLHRLGLVRSAAVFAWYAESRGYAKHIKAGSYRLAPSMSVRQMLERMVRGGDDRPDLAVTIPEGYTLEQVASALERRMITSGAEFAALARSPGDAVALGFEPPPTGLEGYLFPDTYRFLPGTPSAAVAQEMVGVFRKRFLEPRRADIEASGRSLHDIVTIASLIEREARVPRDRARISGVIANRLSRNMKLDIDATVLYALGRHKARVLYRDLEIDSPYNTYRHRGLPPGPIACPGLPSLEAALAPERHDYLYYVARPDGSHVFTRTMDEHLRAVAQMRALRRAGASGG